MEQGITVFDKDFRLTCWNRQYRALFDLPDEMGQVGVSLDRILRHLAERGDIGHDAIVSMLDRLTDFGAPWQIELKTIAAASIELRSNPMPDGGLVATYADITARVEADLALKRVNETLEQRVRNRTAELTPVNEELAQAQMLAEEANLGKTRFLAAAGHDILQPLNAARLYCASLIERAGKGDTAEAAANIESSLESVETILGAVLDISRLDAGAMKPSETVFKLGALLRQIGTDFMPMAAEKKLELRIVPSSIAVETDRNLLRRLIQNLVSNAIKYTRSGRVLVGVRRRGELVELQVIDTGIGIAADKLNTVFREFTRLDEGAREARGLGLGLSIVDRIARVLRLEIRISSYKGKGTRFSRDPAGDRRARAGAGGRGAARKCAPALRSTGWSCSASTTTRASSTACACCSSAGAAACGRFAGSSAIEAQRASLAGPDIVLADYHLDGENGLDAIRKLQGDLRRATRRRSWSPPTAPTRCAPPPS